MKALLAERLLAQVTGISGLQQLTDVTARLRTLADVKYDDYGGYSPGVKFIESLAVWLEGFEHADRAEALEFVLSRLTYISAAELDHLVSTVYQDMLRPHLLDVAAAELGAAPWELARVAGSSNFEHLQRRMLVLGMSDGARLDRLRRASPLSTEQFHLASALDPDKERDMTQKLGEALESLGFEGDPTFSTVVLVDDFSGSGTTMLRRTDGVWKGKLPKIRAHVEDLKERKVVAPDATVLVLLYLLTAQARQQLTERMHQAGFHAPEYRLISAHTFGDEFPLSAPSDTGFWNLCERYFREAWANEHSTVAGDLAHGFGGSALPLVIHHNTPNNSPPVLWKDETADHQDELRDDGWIGLFPRHERHHPGRP